MLTAILRGLSPLILKATVAQRHFASSAGLIAKRSFSSQLPSHINSIQNDPPGTQREGTWENLLGDLVVKTHEPQLFDVDKIWQLRSRTAMEQLTRQPPANAYAGRSVKVVNGNVAEAYKKLEIILSRNKVKYELRRAERHEKKGVKRRRLSSERWRKQFANEVRNKVQLVTQIRKRGA